MTSLFSLFWLNQTIEYETPGPPSPTLLSRTASVWNSRRLWKSEQKWSFCVFYRNPISVFNFRKIWKSHGKGKVMMLTSFLLQITRWLFVLSYGKTSNKTGEQPVLQHCCNESEKVMLTCNLFRLLLENNLLWDVVLTKLYFALILALEFAYNTRVVVILTLLMEPKKNWESHVFFSIN